jgi:hypothetical protein
MENDFLHFGTREIWGEQHPFGVRSADRRQHVYCIGKSGTGKTTLLRNCILQDIAAGRGVAVLDPHGDLAEALMEQIPRWRTDHVVYFNPADGDHPIGLNLLEYGRLASRHLIPSELVSIIRAIWPEHVGPRMEYILYAAAAALSECQNVSLLGLPRMLVDERYRAWVLKQVKDPVVRAFWLTEFASYEKRFLSEAIAPIQNKVGQLLMSPHVRNIVGQIHSRIDARFMMDDSRILICNLAKGRLGEDKARLLGTVLVSKFQLAALSRADIPEESRKDFYFYIDECHNFLSDSFLSILSEARKYRLSLTLAHQYVEQMNPKIQSSIFGNVGSIVAFRVGHKDAAALKGEFGNGFAEALANLENHTVVCRLLEQGRQLDAFQASTAGPMEFKGKRSKTVAARSRERYGCMREKVENRIRRWTA